MLADDPITMEPSVSRPSKRFPLSFLSYASYSGHLTIKMRSFTTIVALSPLVLGRLQASGDGVSNLARDYKTVREFAKKVTVDPNGFVKGWNGTDVCQFEASAAPTIHSPAREHSLVLISMGRCWEVII